MKGLGLFLAWMACGGGGTTGDSVHTPDSHEATEPLAVVTVNSVDLQTNTTLILEMAFDVTLSEEASVAVACTRRNLPEEVHLVESDTPAVSHQIRINGVVAGEDYDCVVGPTGTAVPALKAVSFTVDDLPSAYPSLTIGEATEDMRGGPYTLFSHERLCADEDTIRVVLVDPDGVIRWLFPVPARGSLDMGAEYVGKGQFLWGGVSASAQGAGAPQIITTSHEVVYEAGYPESDTQFHHAAEMLADGSIMTMVQEPAYDGDRELTGFGVHHIDLATDTLAWSWDVQWALDSGALSARGVRDFGANWAGIMNDGVRDVVVISLCDTKHLLAVDPVSNEITWELGERGTLELQGGDTMPLCQHGPDTRGQSLLLYDNGGWEKPETRIVEYAIDAAEGTATQTWEWTEEGWSEPIWGDVDYEGQDRILIARAHSCYGELDASQRSQLIEVDRGTNSVVWRAVLGHEDDGIYNIDRIDGCEVFANARFCPDVAARTRRIDGGVGGLSKISVSSGHVGPGRT